jgi:hypothetical protein
MDYEGAGFAGEVDNPLSLVLQVSTLHMQEAITCIFCNIKYRNPWMDVMLGTLVWCLLYPRHKHSILTTICWYTNSDLRISRWQSLNQIVIV